MTSVGKQAVRQRVRKIRRGLGDRQARSRRAIRRLMASSVFQGADWVMWYVSYGAELETHAAIRDSLTSKNVVVPYCTVDERGDHRLGLWRLTNFSELEEGKWSILEPPKRLWHDPGRQASLVELDLIVVPGVAFSAAGDRLGNGKGYYDRLLSEKDPNCLSIGLGFDCQILSGIPTNDHDQQLDLVCTESTVFDLRTSH